MRSCCGSLRSLVFGQHVFVLKPCLLNCFFYALAGKGKEKLPEMESEPVSVARAPQPPYKDGWDFDLPEFCKPSTTTMRSWWPWMTCGTWTGTWSRLEGGSEGCQYQTWSEMLQMWALDECIDDFLCEGSEAFPNLDKVLDDWFEQMKGTAMEPFRHSRTQRRVPRC